MGTVTQKTLAINPQDIDANNFFYGEVFVETDHADEAVPCLEKELNAQPRPPDRRNWPPRRGARCSPGSRGSAEGTAPPPRLAPLLDCGHGCRRSWPSGGEVMRGPRRLPRASASFTMRRPGALPGDKKNRESRMNKKAALAAAVGAVLVAGWAAATYTTGQKLKTALLAQTETAARLTLQ